MFDINVDEEAESLYNELLKIEIYQKKKNERDINELTGNAIQRCSKHIRR